MFSLKTISGFTSSKQSYPIAQVVSMFMAGLVPAISTLLPLHRSYVFERRAADRRAVHAYESDASSLLQASRAPNDPRNPLSLAGILATHDGSEALRRYLVACLSVENLSFVEAADEFRDLCKTGEHSHDEIVHEVNHESPTYASRL